ncbi:MAG TPA: hydantoinase/oxoprolinase family protein [Vicinamibacterales bacterium]|nr:hydantoinase/oxoprolinase family protein [Vicinamibacterales bacterium]
MSRMGVDTGGTFTDLVLLTDDALTVHKVRSTPRDPAQGILHGIRELTSGDALDDVVHGSTVATNAVLERKGARVGLLVTAGFEDVLRIGRQTRPELYNLMVRPRVPLVDPALTRGVSERIAADGSVLVPIDDDGLRRAIGDFRAAAVEAVAVCFLHSYRNPAHEDHAARLLAEAGLTVSVSHQVLREYREFERWSTTVVNAYVTPLMARYLTTLEAALAGTRLSIMQSNGGTIAAVTARQEAVRTILSGPAAGVVGARAVGEMAGYERLITFDMGGTSTDVSLVDGRIGMTTESYVGHFPVRLPVIDIHTVGAGGGSIAYIDSGGALRVGPRSAGADPGPVCYGSGTELTVSDANLLLGRMHPDYFLGGRMRLDAGRTREVARVMGASLGMSELALADGIVRVANANMERAIRVVSVQRGFDPREFALLAFGGAGGMHACDIAETLEISTVIVPRYAGVLSALGMLLADVTKDYSATILRRTDQMTHDAMLELFEPLVSRAAGDLRREGFGHAQSVITRSVDVRYVGQAYEITVPFSPTYREEFDRQHARLYGYANPQRPTEVVNVRLTAMGQTRKPALPRREITANQRPQPWRTAAAAFGGRQTAAAVYRWEDLMPGTIAEGPAVIAGGQATVVIPPHFSFRVDEFGNVVAVRSVARQRRRRAAAAGTAVARQS